MCMIRFLQEKYGLDNESSVWRFLIGKAAREEGYLLEKKEYCISAPSSEIIVDYDC
jgi:hypothetical protein